MTFVLQDDTGLVADANAYIDDAFFIDYWTDRGNTDATTLPVADIEASIIEATQYIDERYVYKGLPLNSVEDGQNTQFPRSWLYDARGDLVEGLPLLLKQAAAEYAWRASQDPLAPDPAQSQTGQVTYERSRVEGAVEEETRYAEGIQPKIAQSYPVADRLLRQYRAPTGQLLRA